MLKVFLSQNALAARLPLAPITLQRRLRARSVEPEGVCILGRNGKSTMLFDVEKLPDYRITLLSTTPKTVV